MKRNDRQRLIKRNSLHNLLFNAFSRRERHFTKKEIVSKIHYILFVQCMHFHVVKGKFKKKRLFKIFFDYFIVLLNSKKVNVTAKVHVSVTV